MAMNITLQNFIDLGAYFAPYLTIFVFIILGIINNQPLKSVLYSGTLLLSVALILFLQQGVIKEDTFNQRDVLCDLWSIPFLNNAYTNPSLSTFVIVYTLAYILVPMIFTGDFNPSIILFMSLIFMLDTYFRLSKRCISVLSYIVSLVIALVLGGTASALLTTSIPKAMYFTGGTSNKISCSKPSGNKMKCNVYKNGKIIQAL